MAKDSKIEKCRKCGVTLTSDNTKEYRIKHRDFICNSCYKKARRKYFRDYGRMYRATHPEFREYQRRKASEWFENNRERARLSKNRWVQRLHKKVIEKLGGKCVGCGIKDMRILQVNHLKGGGRKDYRKLGAQKLYLMILRGEKSVDDFDVRCSNCNILFEYEVGRRKLLI